MRNGVLGEENDRARLLAVGIIGVAAALVAARL